MPRAVSQRTLQTISIVGVVLVTAYTGLVVWASAAVGYHVWAALVWIPVLMLVTVPMLLRAGRRDPDPRFLQLLIWAFVLKSIATVARYLMAFVLYGGVADASGYDGNGARLAASYRTGDFAADVGADVVGTGFIRVVTGAIYTVTGQSVFVAYAVFSWLGFWGLYFLYRAFTIGVPDGDRRRYALLVLLLPSMLFWPSGLGKEAWMTLGIGLFAYGTALLLNGDRRWVGPLLIGGLASAMVRPHVTAALVAAVGAAVVLRRNPKPADELTPLVRLAAIGAVVVVGLITVTRAASFLGIESVDSSSVDAAIHGTTERTDEGGSSFEPTPVNSPLDMPAAILTVVFRPFLFEATNVQMGIAALEGAVLLLLMVRAAPRLRGVMRRLRRQPYLIFCLVYALMFVYAFSNFSNFGILTRQRVQVLPFVLVFLALPRGRMAAGSGALQLLKQPLADRGRER